MTKARLSALLASAAALWLAALAPAHAEPQGEGTLLANPHHAVVQRFEGTKTCLACHADRTNHEPTAASCNGCHGFLKSTRPR